MYQTDSPSLTHAELPWCVKWHLATHRPHPTRILPGSHAGCPRCVRTTSKGIIHLHVVPFKFDLAEGIDDNGAAKSVNRSQMNRWSALQTPQAQHRRKLTLLEPTQLFHYWWRSICLHGEVNQLFIMDKLHVTLLKAAQLWFPSAVHYTGQGDIFSSLYGYNNTRLSFQWHKMGKARWCGS